MAKRLNDFKTTNDLLFWSPKFQLTCSEITLLSYVSQPNEFLLKRHQPFPKQISFLLCHVAILVLDG
ncbi:hypothetical protein MTR_2g038300 [Medicago truncatula]|uniref:Uncharacterized protein n=1 Tax=Medicago truncatula TaxID=3880 RepID=G7IGB7_MEDTR|nr:hypothetical protein MTR_2g038300 [Medicago truncatula]